MLFNAVRLFFKRVSANSLRFLHAAGQYNSVEHACDQLKILCQQDSLDEALQQAQVLQQSGNSIPPGILHRLLGFCIDKKKSLPASKIAFSIVLNYGFRPYVSFWADHLIRLSAACGDLGYSNWVFSIVPTPSLFTWNSVISANSKHGDKPRALGLYIEMQRQGLVVPDKFTFLGSLKACCSQVELEDGRAMHNNILAFGLDLEIEIGNALLDMYVKCGSLQEGQVVFRTLPHRNVVTWGTMISGYVEEDQGDAALSIYSKMQQDGVEPDIVLLSCVLKACISSADIIQGRLVHIQIVKRSLEEDIIVGNTLINMYIRCGSPTEARCSFDKMVKRDLVSWNSMIAGYAFHEEDHLALCLYEKLQSEGFTPDIVTFSSVLKSCGTLGALRQGNMIHSQIVIMSIKGDIILEISLVEMYAKCGSFDDAFWIVDGDYQQSVKTWNAIVAGCADYGDVVCATKCLDAMQRQGVKPNFQTFTSILAACSHVGLVDEAQRHFKSMIEDHGISPDLAHFNCIIDLLGRTGRLHEAEQLQHTLFRNPSEQGWRSLLASCKTHCHSNLGKECYGQAIDMVPRNASGYMLMSSIYADAQKWEDVYKMQEQRKRASAAKKPGTACMEIDNKVYRFVVGEQPHYHGLMANSYLAYLKEIIKCGGYVPQLDTVVHLVKVKFEEESEVSSDIWSERCTLEEVSTY